MPFDMKRPLMQTLALLTESGWDKFAGFLYFRKVRPGLRSNSRHSSTFTTSVPLDPHQPGTCEGVSSRRPHTPKLSAESTLSVIDITSTVSETRLATTPKQSQHTPQCSEVHYWSMLALHIVIKIW